jgi:hypothetical protein
MGAYGGYGMKDKQPIRTIKSPARWQGLGKGGSKINASPYSLCFYLIIITEIHDSRPEVPH